MTTGVDFTAIKDRQRKVWARADYPSVAAMIHRGEDLLLRGASAESLCQRAAGGALTERAAGGAGDVVQRAQRARRDQPIARTPQHPDAGATAGPARAA